VILFAAVAAPARAGGDAGALIGSIGSYRTKETDTFVDLARRFDGGSVALMAANPGVDPWLPGKHVLVLPTAHLLPDAPHRGIVINVGEMRLYYFEERSPTVESFPIGIGQEAHDTPMGTTRVVKKRIHPTWIPTPSIRAERPELPAAIPPGPDNPLGDYALYLGWDSYTVHGTNKPAGVGRRVSHGCIRLYPEDIAALYPRVDVGTPVTVVAQPAKAGWVGKQLFLEVHPSPAQADQIEQTGKFSPEAIDGLDQIVRAAAGPEAGRVDWRLVLETAQARRGIPVQITH
jgi:L,D-transpeptidase ErfK/SrfK